MRLDEDRARLYFDLILHSLSEAARKALQTMNPAKYGYQSDFAKKYIAMGEAQGRATTLVQLLTARFGSLTQENQTRLAAASPAELDQITDRLLTAKPIDEALYG